MPALTQSQAAALFRQYIKNQNTLINPDVVGTDWWVLSEAVGGVISAQLQDIQVASNGIFVQFMSGFLLDYFDFSIGQPQRMGASFALCDAISQTPYPMAPLTLDAGVIFVSSYNGNNYKLINQVVISDTDPVTISLQASISGFGQQLPFGSFLTYTIDGYTLGVAVTGNPTDGQASETDAQLRARLLLVMQNPVGAARAQQYVTWALQSTPNINGANVIPGFINSDMVSTIGIFTLSGSTEYDTLLVNNAPFSRATDREDVVIAFNYINFQAPISPQPVSLTVSSVATFIFEFDLAVSVTLIPGLTLASLILNIDGSSISVENMILQEVRRGFITYPYGGTQVDSSTDRWILLSRLEQTLDSSLSVNGGIYAQILLDRTFEYNSNPGLDIAVPYQTLDMTTNNLYYVYDSLTATVTVGLI